VVGAVGKIGRMGQMGRMGLTEDRAFAVGKKKALPGILRAELAKVIHRKNHSG